MTTHTHANTLTHSITPLLQQVWLATTYVQVYAFLSMLNTALRCQKHENAWAIKAPVWPLFAVFAGEFLAIGGALFWVGRFGFDNWAQNLLSVLASAALAIYALWPMVSMQVSTAVTSSSSTISSVGSISVIILAFMLC
jgi:hypothetical protein